MENLLPFIGVLILFGLYAIHETLKELKDDFNSWYGDWLKKHDPPEDNYRNPYS